MLALLKLCASSKGMVTTRKDVEQRYHIRLQKVTPGMRLCHDPGKKFFSCRPIKMREIELLVHSETMRREMSYHSSDM